MPGYIPTTPEQQRQMLGLIGAGSVDELFDDIPDEVKLRRPLKLEPPLSEMELGRQMKELAAKNRGTGKLVCFLGAGAYDHYVPSAVRQLVSRQEFYTAYTPYQPEISQGTLQAIFEYQSMICSLTGMQAANASMYDGATAVAEAAAMACSHTGRKEVVLVSGVHPQSREVVNTYTSFRGLAVKQVGMAGGRVDLSSLEAAITKKTAAVILQSPNFYGVIEDIAPLADLAHKNGALLIVSVNPVSLGLLKPPGECGADIVVGEGQPLGGELNYGGPYLGFFACTKPLLRKMPGRVVGMTADRNGKRGYVLTLQAREQHIRRDRATSNICSNEALNALAATIYLSLLGERGFAKLARQCADKAHYTCTRLLQTGRFTPVFDAPFFNEFALRYDGDLGVLLQKLLERGILGGFDLGRAEPGLRNVLLVAVTEKRTKEEIEEFVKAVRS